MDQAEMTLKQAIESLIAAKTVANFRPRYVESLRRYLSQFARGREETPIAAIDVAAVESWFAGRAEAISSRASNAGRLSALFSFSERRGWVQRNPVRQMERIRFDPKTPKILTPEQAQTLMEWAMYQRPRSLAFLSLALFGGVRPEELERVKWEDIEDGVLRIDAAASKTRRRRFVHLKPNAVEWVEFARELRAFLPMSRSTRSRMLRDAAVKLGFDGWPQDILRHSTASYWLAESRDVGLVADELGNSPSILLRHYRELVTPENALAFWSIRP